MKHYTFYLMIGAALILMSHPMKAQELKYGDPFESKIGKMILSKGFTGVAKYWEIDNLKGKEKIFLALDAVELYDNNKSQDVLKGIKVTIMNDMKLNVKDEPLPFRELQVYIDKDEFTNIMISLDDMLKLYDTFKRNNQDMDLFYTTIDNFTFGVRQKDGSMYGVARIVTNDAIIEFRMRNVSKFLRRMKESFDNASQELYLPEKAAKIKKAKGSKRDNEKVIDEGI